MRNPSLDSHVVLVDVVLRVGYELLCVCIVYSSSPLNYAEHIYRLDVSPPASASSVCQIDKVSYVVLFIHSNTIYL